MDMVNLAHGSLYMLGAYFAATFVAWTGSFVAGAMLALGATLLVGMLLEVVAIRPLYGRDHLDHVLGTFGLILFFNELVRIVWGPAGLRVPLPDWLNTSVPILPGLHYPTYRIAIIVTALAVALFLYWLVMRTRLGMLIRAGASNREMAGALGVNIKLLYTLVFGLGAALAGARRPDAGADPHRADRHGREHPDPRLRRHHHRRHRLDPRRLRRRHPGRAHGYHRPRVPARPLRLFMSSRTASASRLRYRR